MGTLLLAFGLDDLDATLVEDAVYVAQTMSHSILPVHANEYVPHYSYRNYDDVRRQVREEIHNRLGRLIQRMLDEQVRVLSPIIADGRATDVISSTASDVRVDMIMLGAGAQTRGARVSLGTTAERVLRRSKQPVWLSRYRIHATPRRQILCATDYSPASTKAADLAAQLQRHGDAALTLLHVAPVPHAYPGLENLDIEVVMPYQSYLQHERPEYINDEDVERAEAERLRCFVTNCDITPTPNAVIAHGKADEEILRHAKSQDADLVVVGTTGHSGLYDRLIGSTTLKVVRQLSCAALVVPA